MTSKWVVQITPPLDIPLLTQTLVVRRHLPHFCHRTRELAKTHTPRWQQTIGDITASPALIPGAYSYAQSNASFGSALTSPALLPQTDLDQEATAALLMLNTDRRGIQGSRGGMSVKDLLST
jgi:hypothetical protein